MTIQNRAIEISAPAFKDGDELSRAVKTAMLIDSGLSEAILMTILPHSGDANVVVRDRDLQQVLNKVRIVMQLSSKIKPIEYNLPIRTD